MSEFTPAGRPVAIADGGLHTRLSRHQEGAGTSIEEMNIRSPLLLQAAHGEFLRAGAGIHRTNTLHATRAHLAPLGLEERVEAINNSAVALLRGVIGPHGVVMGTLGPPPRDATGAAPPADLLTRAYGEQVIYLSDTGVNFFLLEHFDRLADALLVVEVAGRASDAPVLAQLRFGADGNTADGVAAGEAAGRLVEAGAGALGISCGPGPAALPGLLAALVGRGVPVSVMPGLAEPGGLPHHPEAPALDPEPFADMMAGLVAAGANIVGGCCGVTAGHIRALARRCGVMAGGEPRP